MALREHGNDESVWMVRYKQHIADKYVGRLEALDLLIAFGWIDGIARKLDEDRTMQLISPRRQQVWTQTYRERAARLEADGRMEESGRAAIRLSQALGLWRRMPMSMRCSCPKTWLSRYARHGRRQTSPTPHRPTDATFCAGSNKQRSRRRGPPALNARSTSPSVTRVCRRCSSARGA